VNELLMLSYEFLLRAEEEADERDRQMMVNQEDHTRRFSANRLKVSKGERQLKVCFKMISQIDAATLGRAAIYKNEKAV
jgi:hypothetical protein